MPSNHVHQWAPRLVLVLIASLGIGCGGPDCGPALKAIELCENAAPITTAQGSIIRTDLPELSCEQEPTKVSECIIKCYGIVEAESECLDASDCAKECGDAEGS